MAALLFCRFQGLLEDIFPGMTTPEVLDEDMIAAIHNAAASLQLQVIPEQVHSDCQHACPAYHWQPC